MHFYDFNIGDYAKKTQHLTNEEDLAYRRALDMYYDTEKPLLTDGLATLSRRLRVDQKALKNVLDEFFPNGKNKHADEKIAAYYAYLAKQADNGRKGGRPKNQVLTKEEKPTANPPLTDGLPTVNPVPSQPLTTKPLTTKPNKKPLSELSDEFKSFWNTYPRKAAKKKAIEAWNKYNPPIDQVLKALEWQIKQDDWLKDSGAFIPMPATYINGSRWEDEPIKVNGLKKEPPWYSSNESMLAKGKEFGLSPKPGEGWPEFKGRIQQRIGG